MSYTPEEICDILESIITDSKVALPAGHARGLAAAIIERTGRRGIAIVDEDDVMDDPDEQLKVLKTIRKKVLDAIESEDTLARDLASLSRRLQDVSREIYTIEERKRVDARSSKGNGGKKNGASTSTPASSGTGPLDL